MVYAVIVYDVEAERTRLYRKLLRRYLHHVQNSVFEGEITEGKLAEVTNDLEGLLKVGESVIVYRMAGESYVTRNVLGEDPAADSKIL